MLRIHTCAGSAHNILHSPSNIHTEKYTTEMTMCSDYSQGSYIYTGITIHENSNDSWIGTCIHMVHIIDGCLYFRV